MTAASEALAACNGNMIPETSDRRVRSTSGAPASEDVLVKEALVGDALVGDVLVGDALVENASVKNTLAEDAMVDNASVKDAPSGHASVGDASFEACHQVFETAELLEMILLKVYNPYNYIRLKVSDHAPAHEDGQVHQRNVLEEFQEMRTILLSQRVNRMFKATIEGSARLQRTLWFQNLFEDASPGSIDLYDVKLNPVFATGRVPFHVAEPADPAEGVVVHVPSTAAGTESWCQMLVFQAVDPDTYIWEFWGSAFPVRTKVEAECGSDWTAEEFLNVATDEAIGLALDRNHGRYPW